MHGRLVEGMGALKKHGHLGWHSKEMPILLNGGMLCLVHKSTCSHHGSALHAFPTAPASGHVTDQCTDPHSCIHAPNVQ